MNLKRKAVLRIAVINTVLILVCGYLFISHCSINGLTAFASSNVQNGADTPEEAIEKYYHSLYVDFDAETAILYTQYCDEIINEVYFSPIALQDYIDYYHPDTIDKEKISEYNTSGLVNEANAMRKVISGYKADADRKAKLNHFSITITGASDAEIAEYLLNHTELKWIPCEGVRLFKVHVSADGGQDDFYPVKTFLYKNRWYVFDDGDWHYEID